MGYVEAGGYDRDMNYIDDRVVEHPEGGREWPVEAGRYRLVGSR
ncbi:MAG: glutathione S-transferase family protein, partial [Corynebacterium variabile]